MKRKNTRHSIEYLIDFVTLIVMSGLCAFAAAEAWRAYGETYRSPFMMLAVGCLILGFFRLRSYIRHDPSERKAGVTQKDYAVMAALNLVSGVLWLGIGLRELDNVEITQAGSFMQVALLVVGVNWLAKAGVQAWCWRNYDKHVLKK